MKTQLNSCGVPEAEIASVLAPLNRRDEIELARPIADAIRACMHINARDLRKRLNSLPQMHNSDNNEEAQSIRLKLREHEEGKERLKVIHTAEPGGFRSRALIEMIGTAPNLKDEQRLLLRDTFKERLEDLRYFEDNKTHRNLARWLSGNLRSERENAVSQIEPGLRPHELP
jgi:hypothetical protein